MSGESTSLYLEVTPMSDSSQFTVTAREPRQPVSEPDLAAVKQESDEVLEVKELFFKDIMNLSEAEEEANDQPNDKLRCSECHFRTTDADRLMRHVRKIHRGLNPFQCYMCDYSTYNKVLFEEHVRIHRGIKPFKCSYCDYCSASKKNTKKHELIHRPDNPLRCPHCPFIARHHRALICHRKTHSISDGDEDVNSSEHVKKVKCEDCGDMIKSGKTLLSHRRKRRRCQEPQCDAMLCTKLRLLSHMSNVHQIHEDKQKVHRCDECEFSTNSKPRMLLHLIHHPNQHVDETVLDVSILRKYGIMV